MRCRPLLPALAAAALLSACSSTPTPVPLPPPSTTRPPQGDLSQAAMSALLLQAADLPGLTQRRQFASAVLSTQATPQLTLCQAPVPDAPHALANVLAQSGQVGRAEVFEVVSAYADGAAAQAAFDRAVGAAQACNAYQAQAVAFRVEDLGPVDVPAGAQAQHYRLTTPSVVGGDVRTLARSGRFLVLVSGFGAPPGGQPLLDYQADVLRTALRRLP